MPVRQLGRERREWGKRGRCKSVVVVESSHYKFKVEPRTGMCIYIYIYRERESVCFPVARTTHVCTRLKLFFHIQGNTL